MVVKKFLMVYKLLDERKKTAVDNGFIALL